LPNKDADTLVAWGKMDQPSKWEQRYCSWIEEELSITNPLILQPNLIRDVELIDEIVL